MDETAVLAYVKAAAVALALPLDEAGALRVATHLARTAALARQLDAHALEVADEPAQVYLPAPFPGADGGQR
jgi:hypothetical protein